VGTDIGGTELAWLEAIAQSFESHSFTEFHRATLPALISKHGHLVRKDLRGAAPLTFRIPDGDAYTWSASSDGVDVVDGESADGTVVELSERTFSEFVNELLTASGAERTGRASIAQGTLAGWQRWEPAIQSLCSGREIYDTTVWETLLDRDRGPLDLQRAFAVDDSMEEMCQFLAVAGYLHVKAVFSPEEIGRWAEEVEYVRAHTTAGDPFSWWSVNASGTEVVTRINYLGRYSTVLDELCFDERLAHYASLAGPEVRVCNDRLDGPMVFIKNSNVVKGNGDLSWHCDDGLGGHPVMCPLVQAGIQLDHANAANGQLLVLAGSYRYTKHWIAWGEEGELPVVALETEPGDLTIHFGDTMHTTPPPTADGAGRRALYYKFAGPKTFEWVPPNCHYNDALFRADPKGRIANRATTWVETS
jgi:ectoine hydroxylase-related dioxygenase (phytanoyl-CoA dioxygenase family)